MVTPMSECGYVATDFWLMEVLMELGSAQTIFASLCRSIERMKPWNRGCSTASRSAVGGTGSACRPELVGSNHRPTIECQRTGRRAACRPKMTYKSGLKGRRTSGQWRGRVMGVNFWWLETQGPDLRVCRELARLRQSYRKPASRIGFSARLEVRCGLANRIFCPPNTSTCHCCGSRELEAEAAYIN